MKLVFRCNNCETINEIPEEYRYRQCRKCSNIVTYEVGESILCEEQNEDCTNFIQATTLPKELAEKFFILADKFADEIALIARRHDNISARMIDLPSASRPDTVLLLLKQNTTETLDEIVRNCKLFDLDLHELNQIIRKLKTEGMVYHPKGWLIRQI